MQRPNHDLNIRQISITNMQKKLKNSNLSTRPQPYTDSEQQFSHAQLYVPYLFKKGRTTVDTKSQVQIMLLGFTLGLILSFAIGLNLESNILSYIILVVIPVIMGIVLKMAYVHTMLHMDN